MAALLCLVGCRTLPPLEPGTPIAVGDPRVERLLDELERRGQERRSMRGLARLSLDAPDLRLRRPQRVAAERPDRLRVEILGLFSQVAAVLVTGDRHYRFYDIGSRALEEGPLTPELLWRLARVELRADQAIELLLATPGRWPGSVAVGAREMDDGSIAIALADAAGGMRQRLGFDAQGRLRRASLFGEFGQMLWEASFDDYRMLEGGPFAFRLELYFPRLEARATFAFTRAELNPDLPEDVFTLKLPARSLR
jgi:hypothetical protein